MKLQTEHMQIAVGNARMDAYLARPEGSQPRPAVIVWMEIFGVNSHIRDVTERVAREGYVALAPNFFHRTAPGLELGYGEKDIEQGMVHLMKLDADEMIADARAALAYLRGRKEVLGDRIGVVGFCMGGHLTFLTACETDVRAAASYYGGGIAAPQAMGGKASLLSRAGKIRGRITCFFGGRDALIPPDQVEAIRKALRAANVRHEVHLYPVADHGFHCDQRATYHEASARDAWQKTLQLFREELTAS